MKSVAVISPVSMLEEFSTRFHLVLAQYCLKYSVYLDFYRRRLREGDFVLLDNGAAELEASISGEALYVAAYALRPSMVVAPDVIYNRARTLDSTLAFIDRYKERLSAIGSQIMAVPQGEDATQWKLCFYDFNDNEAIDWLGISMFYTPKLSSRFRALSVIASTVRKPCHLLGIWDNPYSLINEMRYDFVRSVDSAKPVEFAIEGLSLPDWANHKHINDDWYFELASLTDKQRHLAHSNIEEMKTIVGY